MALVTISGEIQAQPLNNNFSYHDNLINDISEDLAIQGKYAYNVEHLAAYYEKLRTKTAVNTVLAGDSVIAGSGTADTYYRPVYLLRDLHQSSGVNIVTVTDSGHSGETCANWVSTRLAEDLALNPDLYFFNYGLNDAVLTNPLSTFETNLINGLTTLRASKPNMPVILCTPTGVNHSDGLRINTWIESIYPIIKQAAEDFDCCFMDWYHYLQNPSTTWLDEFLLHPNSTGYLLLMDLLFDTIYPRALTIYNHYTYDITLDSSWTGTLKVFKDASGACHLEGIISGGTTTINTPLTTALPDMYKPPEGLMLWSGPNKILLNSNGILYAQVIPSNTEVSLTGVSYRPGSYK